MDTITELTTDEKAFLEYVSAMRPGVGQRFLKYHVETYGFEAFEQFWDKLKAARYQDPPRITLSLEECDSLAYAMQRGGSRRKFFGAVAGLIAGTVLLEDATVRIARAIQRLPRTMPVEDARDIVLEAGGATIAFVLGSASYNAMDTKATDIAKGKRGEENVRKLAAALDAMFQPVELALAETNPRGL